MTDATADAIREYFADHLDNLLVEARCLNESLKHMAGHQLQFEFGTEETAKAKGASA